MRRLARQSRCRGISCARRALAVAFRGERAGAEVPGGAVSRRAGNCPHRLFGFSLAGLLRAGRHGCCGARSKTTCCRRIPPTPKSWRESGTSMPTANCSPKPRPIGIASRKLLRANPAATSRRPPSIGTISILITRFACSNEGRKKLGDENLYSYEAGAIYENQRDYARAIGEYVKGALAGASEFSRRLAAAGVGPQAKLRDQIDQKPPKLVTAPNPADGCGVSAGESSGGAGPQAGVGNLSRLHRESAPTSIEQAEEIETLAQQKSLEVVRQHALEKQAALTTDPVNRLQLRYQLIQPLRKPQGFHSAQTNVETPLPRESKNPRRRALDRRFLLADRKCNRRPSPFCCKPRRTHILISSKQFTFEAARKSTERASTTQARDLLAGLAESFSLRRRISGGHGRHLRAGWR